MEIDENVLKQLKVLYIEDEPMIRENLVEYFEKRVGSIKAVENGREAIRVYGEYQPNLILTDMEVPGMNGIDLISHFRNVLNVKVPIIVISGYHDEEHHSELADAHLYKPIRLKNVAAKMSELGKKYL